MEENNEVNALIMVQYLDQNAKIKADQRYSDYGLVETERFLYLATSSSILGISSGIRNGFEMTSS